ncbi:MAG: BadF/BadG/BcrA/BcrD ATPase family protein [Alkalilacustris sp.]
MYLLGIDGGGSGCRALLTDRAGRPLGRASAGPANVVTDPTAARNNVLAAAMAAIGERCPAGQISAVLGLAGAQIDGAAEALAASMPFGRVRVVDDLRIAVAGALGTDDGIVGVIGTGSAFARRRRGRLRRLGGWGLGLGDEGSGAWIGRALCSEALRALDRRRRMTPLLRRTLEARGGGHGLVRFARTAQPAAFAALVPDLLEAAARGDAAGLALWHRATAEVIAALEALQEDPPLPVVLVGGLGLHMARAGTVDWPPGWVLRSPSGGALEGAVAMARRLRPADSPGSRPPARRPAP